MHKILSTFCIREKHSGLFYFQFPEIVKESTILVWNDCNGFNYINSERLRDFREIRGEKEKKKADQLIKRFPIAEYKAIKANN